MLSRSNISKLSIVSLFIKSICILSLVLGLSIDLYAKTAPRCSIVFEEGFKVTDYKSGLASSTVRVRKAEDKYRAELLAEHHMSIPRYGMDTKVMQYSYKVTRGETKYDHGTFRDADDMFVALLIKNGKIQDAAKRGVHWTQIYGKKGRDHLIAFKDGREFIRKYPSEKLEFSNEYIAQVHGHMSKAVKPGWQKFRRIIEPLFGWTGITGYIFKPGEFRNTRTRSWDSNVSLKEAQAPLLWWNSLKKTVFKDVPPEKEHLYKMTASHPYLPKFLRPALRRNSDGTYNYTYSYPSHKIIPEALEIINKWANEQMRKIDRGEPDAMDPVELAATVSGAYMYIHPMMDGNGRTFKAMKNQILKKYGLPFDLRFDLSHGTEFSKSFEDYVDNVRFGVYYAVNRLAEIEYKKNTAPSAIDSKIGLEIGGFDTKNISKEVRNLISKKSFPETDEHVFKIGSNERLSLTSRGSFWEDNHGVLYTYVKEENALYPLADRTLRLYGQGGEFFIKKTRTNSYVFRRPNKEYQKIIDANLELLIELNKFKKNRDTGIDPFTIEIKPFSNLQKAQSEAGGFGRIFLYDFQKDLVKESIKSDIDPRKYPYAVLAVGRGNQLSPNRSGPTNHQLQFTTNKTDKIQFSQIVSAYSLRRIHLIKLEKDILAQYPEMMNEVQPLIEKAKRDAYIAARTILGDWVELISEVMNTKPGESGHPQLSGSKEAIEFHKEAQTHDLYKGLYEYSKHQEWFYKTYEEATNNRHIDKDYTYVIRNIADGKHLYLAGILTEAQQAEFIKMAPHLETFMKKLDAAIKTANKEGRKVTEEDIDGVFAKWYLMKNVAEYGPDGKRYEGQKRKENQARRALLHKVVNGVLTEYYSTRGMDKELQRPFIDLYLHTVGFSPQIMKSTSVDPLYEWKLNGKDQLKFFAGGVSFLYKVKINKEATDAESSPYTAQAEVAENAYLHPIKFHFFRKIIKVSEEGLRLTKVDEEGTPMRNPETKELVFTSFGEKTLDILSSIVKIEEGTRLVPKSTPIYNQRYERINEAGDRINEDGSLVSSKREALRKKKQAE